MTVQKTCLIIDDSPIIREIADRIIEDFGLNAPEAENAALGVEYCGEHKVDVVLLDWDLPSMGALDFLRGAGELDADRKPVIILSATENDHNQFTLAKAAGAAFHVLKPFDKHSLETVLREAGVIAGDAPEKLAAANV